MLFIYVDILTIIFNHEFFILQHIYNWIYKRLLDKCFVDLLCRKEVSLEKLKKLVVRLIIGKTIKQRLKEVRKRKVIGYWELDTVVSSQGKSNTCFSTFVKRKSRSTKIQLMSNRKVITFNDHYMKALSEFDNTNLKILAVVCSGKEELMKLLMY